MKKVVRLTESDLNRIVKKIINEEYDHPTMANTKSKETAIDFIINSLNKLRNNKNANINNVVECLKSFYSDFAYLTNNPKAALIVKTIDDATMVNNIKKAVGPKGRFIQSSDIKGDYNLFLPGQNNKTINVNIKDYKGIPFAGEWYIKGTKLIMTKFEE